MELKKFLIFFLLVFSCVFSANEIIMEDESNCNHWFSKVYKTQQEAEQELYLHDVQHIARVRKYDKEKYGLFVKNIRFMSSQKLFHKKNTLTNIFEQYQNLLSSKDVILAKTYVDSEIFNPNNDLILLNWYELHFLSYSAASSAIQRHQEIAEYFDVVECIKNDFSCWKIMLKSNIRTISSYNSIITDYVSVPEKEYIKTHKAERNSGKPLLFVKKITKQLCYEDNMWKMKVISEE